MSETGAHLLLPDVLLRSLLLFAVTATAFADAPDAAGLAFFEKNIRPVLASKCYKCHSAESE